MSKLNKTTIPVEELPLGLQFPENTKEWAERPESDINEIILKGQYSSIEDLWTESSCDGKKLRCHYFVDVWGHVYNTTPITKITHHTSGRNGNAICIYFEQNPHTNDKEVMTYMTKVGIRSIIRDMQAQVGIDKVSFWVDYRMPDLSNDINIHIRDYMKRSLKLNKVKCVGLNTALQQGKV